MGKCRKPSVKIVQSWIDRGYGQGEQKDYRPFLFVRDVPSTGRSSMVLGLKTGRVHHYLSDIEYFHHILAEYEPATDDIREQYALLPWQETQEIAEELKITHPIYPGTNTPIVMTSDIVLTIRGSDATYEKVISVKCSNALEPSHPQAHRTYEKLLIEKTYWQRRGIQWCVSTEKNIPMIRAKNLDLLRTSMVARELDYLQPYMQIFIRSLNRYWIRSMKLLEILEAVSKDIKLTIYQCHMLLARAIWMRLIPVDLDSEIINHQYPMKESTDSGCGNA